MDDHTPGYAVAATGTVYLVLSAGGMPHGGHPRSYLGVQDRKRRMTPVWAARKPLCCPQHEVYGGVLEEERRPKRASADAYRESTILSGINALAQH